MSKTARFLLAALCLFVLARPAAPAFAAAPPRWESISVTLQADETQSMLLVSGDLPPGAALPCEAELAVPAGTRIQWFGEILGGPSEQDPTVTFAKKSTVDGMDVYRFTLTKSRTAQVEGIVQGMSAFDGTNHASTLKWTAWQAVPKVGIMQRVPQGAQIVAAAPGATLQPGDGFGYYTKTVTDVKAGDVVDLTFSYAVPAGGTATGAGTVAAASSAPWLAAVLGLIACGAVVFSFVVWRKLAARAQGPATVETPRRAAAKAPRASAAGEPEPKAAPVGKKRVSMLVPTIVVVGLFAAGAFAISAASAGTPVVDGKITKNFGAASPCTSASIPVTPNEGVDLASQGGKLLDAFKGKDGVGVVTIDIARSVADVTFCASSQSEESMRQVLSGTGLVTVGAAPAAAAPAAAVVSKSGKRQTAKVDTSGESYNPSQVILKAGVPAEIEFAQATGCLAQVNFPQLGLTQDLQAGPAIVKVPALDPGTYDFACGMGHAKGQLIVQ